MTKGFHQVGPVLVLMVACSSASRPPSAHETTATPANDMRAVLFKNVRVFDGDKATSQLDVLVRGDTIAEVGTALSAPGAEVVDGTGKTLLPGLIDAHAHVHDASNLRQAAVFGVTTVLDMLAVPKTARELKAQLGTAAGRELADLRTAGNPVTASGGHGTEYGIPIPTIKVTAEAQAFVDARLAEGSDYIKLIYDDGRAYGIKFGNITKDTLAAAVGATHARKKLAVAHIGTQHDARDAIEVGVDGLAHLFIDSPPSSDFATFAARHRVFVVPTLSVLQAIVGSSGGGLAHDPQLGPYLTEEDVESLARSFPPIRSTGLDYSYAEATVRQLRDAGVALLAGTDAPNPGTTCGASMHGELALLVQAGLTPTQALAAATSVPAARFQLTDRGRIAARMRADLLLVEGDPTTNIQVLRQIVGVWKQGARVGREAYLAEVAKQRALAQRQAALPPEGSKSGLVSDFDDGKPSVAFGHGWNVLTDAIMGGTSIAELKVIPEGAEGSKGSLLVAGEVIVTRSAPSWAGAMFSPGAMPMTPVNLSSKKEISFWARGDGQTYLVLLYAKSRGFRPARQKFEAGKTWKQYTFPLSAFDGLDGRDLTGMFFGAGPPAAKFRFQIDKVEIR